MDNVIKLYSLQPWRSYQHDGCILFSDILTPLPAMGIDFDITEKEGIIYIIHINEILLFFIKLFSKLLMLILQNIMINLYIMISYIFNFYRA